MLKAVLEGKAGKVSLDGAEEVSWREVFRKREDLLTAVFFGRIRYLSAEGEQNVIALLVGDDLASSLGEVREVIFWPKLKGLENRKHVEPDVLVQFKDSLLAIEVKPPLGGNQREDQWREQVQSLIAQRDKDDPGVEVPESFHFLALGRNMPDAQDIARGLEEQYANDGLQKIHTSEWTTIFHGLHVLADAAEGRDRVIYDDWLHAFCLFGLIEKALPFSDLMKFGRAISADWRKHMQAYDVQEIGRTLPTVDWRALGRLCKVMRLGIGGWK